MTPRRTVRLAVRALAAALALLAAYVVVTFVQVWMQSGHDGARPAQAIIVLGAAQYDGVPSPVLARRLDHAAELYQQGLAPLIVVTGGRQPGDRFTEAGASATYLERLGVPGQDIERETTGETSWESLAAAARFLEDRGVDDVLLVSDGYHNLRIGGIAASLGLDAEVSPAPGSTSFGSLARETVAVAFGRILGYDRLVRLDERVRQAHAFDRHPHGRQGPHEGGR